MAAPAPQATPAPQAAPATTTRALFLEIVLDLVIFALCAVICLQVFATAHQESARSGALSQLGIEAQRIAEVFKEGPGGFDALASQPATEREGDTLRWHYDKDLLPVAGADGASFTLSCTFDGSEPVARALITLSEGSQQLLAYDVRSYRGSAGEAP
jgi:hypothetical protein